MLESLHCVKMKTKYPLKYSSFYVSVNEEKFNELKKAEHWPKGALVLPFYGQMRTDRLNNVTDPGIHDSVLTEERKDILENCSQK